jgi:hypothetical protein
VLQRRHIFATVFNGGSEDVRAQLLAALSADEPFLVEVPVTAGMALL